MKITRKQILNAKSASHKQAKRFTGDVFGMSLNGYINRMARRIVRQNKSGRNITIQQAACAVVSHMAEAGTLPRCK